MRNDELIHIDKRRSDRSPLKACGLEPRLLQASNGVPERPCLVIRVIVTSGFGDHLYKSGRNRCLRYCFEEFVKILVVAIIA
jgi:hypothetical protein